MARGYSASRSKSKRPTLRQKRQRSLSIQSVRHDIEVRKQAMQLVAPLPDAGKPDRAASQRHVKDEQPSAGTARPTSQTHGSVTPRVRSRSTMRRQLEVIEAELQDEHAGSEDESETVMRADVMTKYKTAGRALDEVMGLLAKACVAGANTKDLCDQGDRELVQRLQGVFTKAKDEQGRRMARGVAYPTNISVNEVLCNHAPFRREDAVVLANGDVVKLHLGGHLDGYPVSAARTVVVLPTAAAATPPASRDARVRNVTKVVQAARVALMGMMRLLRPGAVNADITDFIARVGHSFGVQAVEGVLSNRTKRWVPDAMDCIITRRVMNEVPQQDVADCTVRAPQVWTLDVAFTDSESYKTTATEAATTLFRRTPADFPLDARVQQANEVLNEITDKHFCFPFHFGSLAQPLRAKMGINVLVKKGVVDALPCLRVKGARRDRVTARFSATVAVTPKRVTVLCGAPPEDALSAHSASEEDEERATAAGLPEDICALLAQPLEHAAAAVAARDGAATRPAKRTRLERVVASSAAAMEDEEA